MGPAGSAVQQVHRGLELLTDPEHWRYRIAVINTLALVLLEAKDYDRVPGPAAEALAPAQQAGIDYYLASAHAPRGAARCSGWRRRAGVSREAAGLARRALARFEELHADEAGEVRAFLAGLEGG